jgi:hypothetical protein
MARKKKLVEPNLETHEKFKARAAELFKPIDQQIMMCDNVQDLMALAATMLNSSITIFRNNLGPEGTCLLLQDMLDEVKKMK